MEPKSIGWIRLLKPTRECGRWRGRTVNKVMKLMHDQECYKLVRQPKNISTFDKLIITIFLMLSDQILGTWDDRRFSNSQSKTCNREVDQLDEDNEMRLTGRRRAQWPTMKVETLCMQRWGRNAQEGNNGKLKVCCAKGWVNEGLVGCYWGTNVNSGENKYPSPWEKHVVDRGVAGGEED